MTKPKTTSHKLFAIIGALITWTAVVLQLYLIIINRTASMAETLIRFFSFFTILTNILVALCFTAEALNKQRFLTKTTTLTAVAVYITIVGITYNVVLRGLWAPQGLQRIVDEALHVITPLLFIVYWFVAVNKSVLQWKNILSWLIYPAVYLAIVILRGNSSGFYPYPFLDVNKSGMNKVWMNSGMVAAGFVIVSIIFIGIAKLLSKKSGKPIP